MNVLQINAVNDNYSTGRTAKEMSDFLLKNGHNSVVAYSKGPSFDPEHEYHIGSNLDTKIHGFMSRLTGKQGYFSRGATKKLLKFMDEYKPDVVVLRNLHGNYINLPILLKYLSKNDIATVVVLHDCWFYTGKCCHYTIQGCFKWQVACGGCPQLKNHNKSWFFDRTKKLLADKKKLFGAIPRLAVVGVSDWLTNEAKKSPVFENAKIITRIYNWIDTEKFSPKDTEELREKLGLEGKKVILSVASGWSKEKGLDTVLELAKKLNADEQVVLVGNLPSDVSLNDKILHIPATNSVDELAELYSMADVFLQPSLEETFGKVTAEALACGTPVICFDSTTTPELIDESCGTVVINLSATSMLNAVWQILRKDKIIIPEDCRNKAINQFYIKSRLAEYILLFETLLNIEV